jgi:hypothetical protein
MRGNGLADESADLEPGQIWLIETPVTNRLSALDKGVLCRADAVLYERALAPLIAEMPLAGSYVEVLRGEVEEGGPAISARALKLASEGWSVVQLVQPCRQGRRRLRGIAEELGWLSETRNLAIRLIARTVADPCAIREARLCDLPELVDGAGEDEPLTLIVGPLGGAASAAPYAFTAANGLAG